MGSEYKYVFDIRQKFQCETKSSHFLLKIHLVCTVYKYTDIHTVCTTCMYKYADIHMYVDIESQKSIIWLARPYLQVPSRKRGRTYTRKHQGSISMATDQPMVTNHPVATKLLAATSVMLPSMLGLRRGVPCQRAHVETV